MSVTEAAIRFEEIDELLWAFRDVEDDVTEAAIRYNRAHLCAVARHTKNAKTPATPLGVAGLNCSESPKS